jgi:hypothetical protein
MSILIVLAWLALPAAAKDRKTKSRRANEAGQSEIRQEDPAIAEMTALVRRAQETADEARREAQEARARVNELEVQIVALQASLKQSGGEPGKVAADAVTVPQPPPLDERMTRIEEQVEINSAQIREQAQTKVESDSRFHVRLSGMVLANFHYNSDDVQRTTPLFAPAPGAEVTRGTLGSTFRQTRLGLAMSGPRFAGARLSAEADFDFYGGTTAVFDGDLLGALRIRTASARLDWEHTSITIGQEAPIISPRNPTSLAAVWYPALTASGNLWQWRPQASAEHRFAVGDKTELIAQVSFMPPFGDAVNGSQFAASPSYEGRFAWRRNLDSERAAEVGVGVHYGRRDFNYDRQVNGYIIAGDWGIPISRMWEVSGELYHGRAIGLSEQSGGRLDRIFSYSGVLDNPNTTVRGVRSTGGWAQLTFEAHRDLELNLAYGQDDADNGDLRFGFLSETTRLKNQAGSMNAIYQLRPNFFVSLEYRRLWTDYAAGRRTNNHYNLGIAYVF